MIMSTSEACRILNLYISFTEKCYLFIFIVLYAYFLPIPCLKNAPVRAHKRLIIKSVSCPSADDEWVS